VLVDGEWVDIGLKGDASTRALCPGPFTVEVYRQDASTFKREATVSAGEVVELDLR